MFKSCTNYFLKRRQISHHFCKGFSKPNFSKEYLNELKKNLSDFQNTFGFDESLREMRIESIAREKKLVRVFTVFGIFVFTAGSP